MEKKVNLSASETAELRSTTEPAPALPPWKVVTHPNGNHMVIRAKSVAMITFKPDRRVDAEWLAEALTQYETIIHAREDPSENRRVSPDAGNGESVASTGNSGTTATSVGSATSAPSATSPLSPDGAKWTRDQLRAVMRVLNCALLNGNGTCSYDLCALLTDVAPLFSAPAASRAVTRLTLHDVAKGCEHASDGLQIHHGDLLDYLNERLALPTPPRVGKEAFERACIAAAAAHDPYFTPQDWREMQERDREHDSKPIRAFLQSLGVQVEGA